MRKIVFVAFLAAFALLVASTAAAQTQSRVTVGGAYWYANYSMVDKDGNKLGDFGNGNMVGPYLRFSHGKFNMATSMFFGRFPVEEFEQIGGEDLDLNMGRMDLNFTLGYQISRYINFFGGVKYLRYSFDGAVAYYDWDSWGNVIYVDADFEVIESGPLFGIGVSGVMPLGRSPFYGFGSLSGMGGTLTNETKVRIAGQGSASEKIDLTAALGAITLGIGYYSPSGLGVTVGYRADLFDENVDETDEDARIYVQGLTLTVSHTF